MGYTRGSEKEDGVKGVRKAGGGEREREGEEATTTREDTRKEEGVRRASRNPVYVSRYRNGGREKH